MFFVSFYGISIQKSPSPYQSNNASENPKIGKGDRTSQVCFAQEVNIIFSYSHGLKILGLFL